MVKSFCDLLIKQLKFGVIAFIVFIAPNSSFAQYGLAIDSIEAENGTMTGVFESNTLSGYSGRGYVTGFDSVNNKVTVKPTIKEKRGIQNYYSVCKRHSEDSISDHQY